MPRGGNAARIVVSARAPVCDPMLGISPRGAVLSIPPDHLLTWGRTHALRLVLTWQDSKLRETIARPPQQWTHR